MTEVAIIMAKLSGIRKALSSIITEENNRKKLFTRSFDANYSPSDVQHYFDQADKNVAKLRTILPTWYEDFHSIVQEPRILMSSSDPSQPNPKNYSKEQLEQLVRDIDQIFEIRANSEISQPNNELEKRVFISHGQSIDWRNVQAFIEKDVCLQTIELAQQPNGGQTIIEKLESNSANCSSAVIVMTGDDLTDESETRVRENVMHEIGYFHGKYGRQAVILLHEDGVNIPTNLSGIVYVPFPKGIIEASLHVLQRELKSIYHL